VWLSSNIQVLHHTNDSTAAALQNHIQIRGYANINYNSVPHVLLLKIFKKLFLVFVHYLDIGILLHNFFMVGLVVLFVLFLTQLT
jgi:hypothetical protein